MILNSTIFRFKNSTEFSYLTLDLKVVLTKAKLLLVIPHKEGWEKIVKVLLPLVKSKKIIIVLHDLEEDRYFLFKEWMIENKEPLVDYDEFDKAQIKEGLKEP